MRIPVNTGQTPSTRPRISQCKPAALLVCHVNITHRTSPVAASCRLSRTSPLCRKSHSSTFLHPRQPVLCSSSSGSDPSTSGQQPDDPNRPAILRFLDKIKLPQWLVSILRPIVSFISGWNPNILRGMALMVGFISLSFGRELMAPTNRIVPQEVSDAFIGEALTYFLFKISTSTPSHLNNTTAEMRVQPQITHLSLIQSCMDL